jgi:hypothetical protein
MPVGLTGTRGAGGNATQSNNEQQSFMESMRSFFTGGNKEQNNVDPFYEAPAPAPAPAPKLEDFTNLFTPKAPDPNAAKEETPVDPFAVVDKKNLAEAAAGIDFSSAVPDELVSKAINGDVTAFRQALNLAVQASFVEGMAGSNSLADKRIKHSIDTTVNQLVQRKLNDYEVDKTISANPLLSNPATKPIRDALTHSLRTANPNISATELNNNITQYLTAFASSVTATNSPTPTPGKANRLAQAQQDALDF